MKKEQRFNNKTVVITGASSGIARATALLFAKKGARLALISRRQKELAEVIADIEKMNGFASAHPLDVTDEKVVRRGIAAVMEKYGSVDILINAASVIQYGAFNDTPSRIFNRVLEVNVLGYVNMCRAVIPVMKDKNKGTIINVSSVVGKIPQPYATAYTTSKFAIRGFSLALRQELLPFGISVSVINPPSTDTPIYQRAANYSGKGIRPLKPLFSPYDVARKIITTAINPKEEITIGTSSKLLSAIRTIASSKTDALFGKYVANQLFTELKTEHTEGNLFSPLYDNFDITGGWEEKL